MGHLQIIFQSSSSTFVLPILFLSTFFLLNNNFASGYNTQHFYLPSRYFGNILFDRPSAPRPSAIQKPSFYVNSAAEEPKVLMLEEEIEDDDEKTSPKSSSREHGTIFGGKGWERAAGDQAIPRRQMRHLLADEFGNGRMGRQYKRMRPCFYSPIQCLMRKRRSEAK